MCDIWGLTSYTWCKNLFKVLLHCSMYQYFILLAIVKRPSMNICEQVLEFYIILMNLYFRVNIYIHHLKASIEGSPHSGANLSVLQTMTKS